MTFDEYVAQRLGGLLRFAMVITCDGQFAEDVVQDVLVRVHGRWHRIAAMEQPEEYLRRMTVHEYLSWRRRSRRLHTVPGDAVDHGENAALIRRIVELPPQQRVVIAMRFFDDRSQVENADFRLPRALEQIADQAPDPSALQARLADRLRAHRQRRTVLVTATALGAGAAVGIPAALALRRPARPRATATRALLGLRPTWVPDGLVAHSRSASADSLYSEQRWRIPPAGDELPTGIRPATMLLIEVGRMSTLPDQPVNDPLFDQPNTTVGGRPARSEPPRRLKWLVTDDILAGVSTSMRDDLDLHRIAESMVDDDRAVCEVAMSAGWLPTVIAEGRSVPLPQKMQVQGTAERWLQEVTYAERLITIRLASTPFDESSLPAPFETLTVRGQPGRSRYLRGGSGFDEQAEVLIDLSDGRYAQVKCYIPLGDPAELRATTIRIAEELSIGPNPDLGWLGRPLP